LLSEGEVTMYNFFVTFMAVFYSGIAASEIFQFSTSMWTLPSSLFLLSSML
jgi:ATP-binding cassette subfamily B (MDR/TAP) protein 1